MLAVDTNVLLRNIVQDDDRQAEAARHFLQKLTPEQPGFICREVALELVWVLERTYKFPRTRIADLMLGLTGTAGVVIENVEDISDAAHRYRQSSADFSDLMILAAAKRVRAKPLYTFDQKLARMEGAALLSEP